MVGYIELFGSMLLLMFTIFCFVFGAFTAYFGAGRSQNIGGSLIILGIVGLLLLLWFTGLLPFMSPVKWDIEAVLQGSVSLIGGMLGIACSLGIFLATIMKS